MKKLIAAIAVVSIFSIGCVTTQDVQTLNLAKTVSYELEGKKFEGHYVSPGENSPLVLLIHDWDGLTDYEIKRADMLAKLGYSVFAADMFGAGVRPTGLAEKQKLTGELYANRQKMRSYMIAALQAAQKEDADIGNAVAMGYCFGGTCILELARSGSELKGFAGFHAGLETPEDQDYSDVQGKVIIFHGTADKHVTMEHFAKLAADMEKHNVKHEMITYSGAPHAFSVFGSDRYRKEADMKSWKRFTEFLAETLSK